MLWKGLHASSIFQRKRTHKKDLFFLKGRETPVSSFTVNLTMKLEFSQFKLSLGWNPHCQVGEEEAVGNHPGLRRASGSCYPGTHAILALHLWKEGGFDVRWEWVIFPVRASGWDAQAAFAAAFLLVFHKEIFWKSWRVMFGWISN